MPPEPHDLLQTLNERDRPTIFEINRELAGPRGSRTVRVLDDFRSGLGFEGPEQGGLATGASLSQVGASAFVKLLRRHAAFSEGRELEVGFALFGEGPDDPALFAARRDATEILIVGALALGAVGLESDTDFGGLMHVGLGADALSRTFRHALLGKLKLDPERFFEVPDWLLESPLGHGCYAGVQDALAEFGRAVLGSRSAGSATGITSLTPNVCCAGGTVSIEGSGFGATQPTGRDVFFPSLSGRCSMGQVQSWSDSQIVAVAPANVGTGCVGFVDGPSGGGSVSVAASNLAGELLQCVGLAAAGAAAKLRNFPPAIIECPPCLPGGANRLSAGPPTIDLFLVNGGSAVNVEPNTVLSLSWRVTGANSVSITRTSPAGPFSPLPSPLPHTGTHALGAFVSTKPAAATYRLVASNGCGTVTRTVEVNLQKTPALSVAAIEVVQAIQNPTNTIRLVARKRTAVRVFVASGISDGFDSGAGPNLLPGVSGTVTVRPAGAGFSSSALGPFNISVSPPLGPFTAGGEVSARPAGTFNRGDGTHSLNFELPVHVLNAGPARVDVRVFAAGHQADVGGPYAASASTTVTFLTQPTQLVLPFLISDPPRGNPAPTPAQYSTSLDGARSRFPIADDGFIVNPSLFWSTTGFFVHRDLTNAFGWALLLSDVASTVLLFSSTPVGGVRTGLVPNDPAYALNGMGSARVGARIPAQLSRSGLQGTFAHEMGHMFGLVHANCCLPPGEAPDSRLPGSTDDVGMDVMKATVIPAGRGEIMSYCGDTSSCPGATRWPSTSFWDLIFGAVPI